MQIGRELRSHAVDVLDRILRLLGYVRALLCASWLDIRK